MIKGIGNFFYKLDTFNKKKNLKNFMWMLMASTGLFIFYSMENFHEMVSSGVLGFLSTPLYIVIPSAVAILIAAFVYHVLWLGKKVPFSYSLQTASINEFIAAICSCLMLIISKDSVSLSNGSSITIVLSTYFFLSFIFAIATSKHIHDRDYKMFTQRQMDTDEDFLMDDDSYDESDDKYQYPYEVKVVKGIIGNMLKSIIYLLVRMLVAYGFLLGVTGPFV